MADYVQVPPDSTGKKVDAKSMDLGADTVYRQRMIVADATGTATYATVMSSGPAGTEGGLVVRNIPSGVQTVTGGVAISGTALSVVTGFVEKTTNSLVQVGDSANAAIRVNIVAELSSTATIAGVVGLTAGTANIGFINNISATVNSIVTGFMEKTTGSIVPCADSANAALRVMVVSDLSSTAIVAGIVAMGPTAIPSASHGPVFVVVSTSATVSLVTAPGAGLHIYVTHVACTNRSGTLADALLFASASTHVKLCMAANGGGFSYPLNPPWKLQSNTALLGCISPNVTECFFNINFYVAP